MRIGFRGELADEPEIRAGFIGCGSHSFRNIYPTFQFAPVRLVATCDLRIEKARAFAAKFGAERAYADYREMLDTDTLDAVFVVVGYDKRGRPAYPPIAIDCLRRGLHVWIEKPPAAACAEIDAMCEAAQSSGRHVMVGFKKMFMPANEKAKELMEAPDFGRPSLLTLQYPQRVPDAARIAAYLREGEERGPVRGFLDHVCHPASLLLFLGGMPETLCYERSASEAGAAIFTFASGMVASMQFTGGASTNGGMEQTRIVSDSGKHILVDNNVRVSLHRHPGTVYGAAPSYYLGAPGQAAAVWEPEFSLGQLYNKGLFLLGYYGEINEFARSILEGRPPAKGTLEQAWQATRIFEAFAQGAGKRIPL
ncbi:MAG: Gfo/Idh/MocA family oxidoreductase [Candidatus Sumerlaeota bacterium]|nr:Gfo/Idh/MocA family oxidoreductase [Candidatus Sumerlaeota bacterium]